MHTPLASRHTWPPVLYRGALATDNATTGRSTTSSRTSLISGGDGKRRVLLARGRRRQETTNTAFRFSFPGSGKRSQSKSDYNNRRHDDTRGSRSASFFFLDDRRGVMRPATAVDVASSCSRGRGGGADASCVPRASSTGAQGPLAGGKRWSACCPRGRAGGINRLLLDRDDPVKNTNFKGYENFIDRRLYPGCSANKVLGSRDDVDRSQSSVDDGDEETAKPSGDETKATEAKADASSNTRRGSAKRKNAGLSTTTPTTGTHESGDKGNAGDRGDVYFGVDVGTLRALVEARPEKKGRMDALGRLGGLEGLADALRVRLEAGLREGDDDDLAARAAHFGTNEVPPGPRSSFLDMLLGALEAGTRARFVCALML